MVQRKVINKLGIQADQIKTNKLLMNLKPSSLQHPDAKNKGADLKKKMKKSKPTKRSDLERFDSPNMRRQVPQPQPGKPPPQPPPVFPTTAASPQKKSPFTTSETTPNYMKSTTSSDARKERSQVSSRNLQTLFDSKSFGRKDLNSSKISSGSSVHKEARMLARTSSLKKARTLTKTTSFKPSRASAKKCSPLVLSENLNVQRSTCSSTLKDSKFPDYLALSSGGTESEGTSIMKVCPYTYCSLNGHHHPPLPPLKCFMSSRRRMLKTQRCMKLGCLSPRRSKPISSTKEQNQVEQKFDPKSPNQDTLSSSITSPIPIIEDEHMEFFIEIYSKERETTAEIADSSFNRIMPSFDGKTGGDETAAQLDDRQVFKIVSDESPFSETDSDDDRNGNSDPVSSGKEAAEYSQEVQNAEADEEADSCFKSQEKSKLGSLSWSDGQDQSRAIIPIDNPEFGPSDMDWEAENFSTIYLDYEAEDSLQSSQDTDLEGDSFEFGSSIIPDESIFKSDDTVKGCFEEIQAGVVLQQSFDEESLDEESVSSKAGSDQDFEIEEFMEGLENQSHDHLGLQVDDGTGNAIKTQDFIDYYKNGFEQDDDADQHIWDLIFQEFHDTTEQSSNEECKGSIGSKDEVEPYHSDANNNTSSFDYEALIGSILPKENDSESEKNCFNIQLLATDAEVGVKVDPVNALIRIENCISLQGSSGDIKDIRREDHDDNHMETIEIDGKSDQSLAGMNLDGTQDHSSDEKSISNTIENLNCSQEYEAEKCESSKSVELGGEETCPTPKDRSGTSTENDHPENHSCQELAATCNKLNWKTGCKRSMEEGKEPKEFNPRGPNFLPVEPDLEAEKVDLKHQIMDERKNADEWMLDYAIQQAVTKLAPARKKKVALLVEAFETVLPVPRYETQLRHNSVAFTHARPIQACS